MNANRPPMTPKEAKEFTKLYSKLNKEIIAILNAATTMEQAKEGLEMMRGMAGYDLPQAKTMYGLALIMEGKPWYDMKKGLEWMKKGAEEAVTHDHGASFCMYQLGLFLLDGLQGVPADPITGKYWIEKAAAAGHKEAKKELRKRW